MSDKFSFYQTEGLWGIIENASDEKQTSIKSYFGSDLIIKRLNEQAEQIDQLKQQLAEKDKEIKKLNWQLKDKDFIIKNLNHSLSVAPNANAGQRARIDELTKIVKEKDKEIELLNAMISTLPEHDKEIKEYELEKVKDFILENTMLETETAAVLTYIYQQIKELKGQKDVTS